MKIIFLSIAFAMWMQTAQADAFTDKIQIGLTRNAVIAVFGRLPNTETCQTVLTIAKCNLIWSQGIFVREIYEITLIAGHVVAISTVSKRLIN